MITAIHVEDEPRNIELLESLVKIHCGDIVNLVGSARNVADAIALIKKVKPQLVYIDLTFVHNQRCLHIPSTVSSRGHLCSLYKFVTYFQFKM